MDLYQLTSNKYVNTFHVKGCAELFQKVYGGTIKEIIEHNSHDQNQTAKKPTEQTQ